MSRGFRRSSRREAAQTDASPLDSGAQHVQPASATPETTVVSTLTDSIEVGAGDKLLASGDENRSFYIYAYGEKAGDHTLSDLSAGDKVYIWVEEGSTEDYTYILQGADTLVTIGQSSILLKNFNPDDLRDFVSVEQNIVFTIDPIEEPTPISSTDPTGNAGTHDQTILPSAGDNGETTARPSAGPVASETRDAVPTAGEENERFYVYAYGEKAGNHTIDDFSTGDRLYIWTEEGSRLDYAYEVRGQDTFITIGQSTILLKNYVTDNLRESVFAEQNITLRTTAIDEPADISLELPRVVPLHVYGTPTDDLILGDGYRAVFGGGGSDTIAAGRSDVVLAGEDGNDLVIAHSGRSSMFGDGGNDTIIGSSGADSIEGGSGSNVLIGGSGSDEFVYWGPLDFEFSDTIADFGTGDRISIYTQEQLIDISFLIQDSGTLVKIGQSSVLLENFFAENVRDFVTVHDDFWVRIDRLEMVPSGELV
jgi:Ca2+-binding RTX toxin-like protein